MRLFLCLLVLLFSAVSAEEECVIVSMKDSTAIDLGASKKVTGVDVAQLEEVEVAATDQEQFGDLCAQECCQNEKCNIAEVTFGTKEVKCQLIHCVPLDKCIWKQSTETISIVLEKEQFTTTGPPSVTTTTPSKIVPASNAPTSQAISSTKTATANNTTTTITGQYPMNPSAVPSTQSTGVSAPPANQNVTHQMTAQSAIVSAMSSTPQASNTDTSGIQGLVATPTPQSAPTNQSITQSTIPTAQQQQQLTTTTIPFAQTNSTTQQPMTKQWSPQTTTMSRSATTNATTPTVSNKASAPNITTSQSNSTTTATFKTTSLTTANATGPFNATAAPVNGSGDDEKLSAYSLAAIFGTSITVSLLLVFIVSHRFYESWKRRHYKQVDYLIDGLYE